MRPMALEDRYPNLHVSRHPLVAHKLSLLRDKRTDPKQFRELVRELSWLIGYEAMADLTTQPRPIETPLEAMAVGTPVVAYAAGALPEVLGDCAEMVPEGDRAALADIVVRLLDDPQRREELVACGTEMMRTRFSLESTVAGMVERYRDAASSS